MQHYTYLLINVCIVLFPLIFSFESRIAFFKKWKQLLFSALPISVLFILWDVLATARTHWAFNPDYITGLKIANLPIEEVLFFITVPYSSLFLYELTKYSVHSFQTHREAVLIQAPKNQQSKKTNSYKHISSFISLIGAFLLFFISGFLVIEGREYASFVLLLTIGITVLLAKTKELQKKSFGWWICLMMVLFFMTNLILTGLPVVTYGREFITNIYIGTIPVEDVLYNWCLLGSYLMMYNSKVMLGKIKLSN